MLWQLQLVLNWLEFQRDWFTGWNEFSRCLFSIIVVRVSRRECLLFCEQYIPNFFNFLQVTPAQSSLIWSPSSGLYQTSKQHIWWKFFACLFFFQFLHFILFFVYFVSFWFLPVLPCSFIARQWRKVNISCRSRCSKWKLSSSLLSKDVLLQAQFSIKSVSWSTCSFSGGYANPSWDILIRCKCKIVFSLKIWEPCSFSLKQFQRCGILLF